MCEQEEMFDVVNELNQVIDVMPRSEVHRLGLRHRAVHIFLFRSDGRMLIHLRTASKVEFPSVWTSSASGHVTSGEDADDCAGRELQEELRVAAKLKFCFEIPACPDTCMEFTRLYRADSDNEVVPDPGEIADVKWLKTAEIHEQMNLDPVLFSPAFRLLFAQFVKTMSLNN